MLLVSTNLVLGTQTSNILQITAENSDM